MEVLPRPTPREPKKRRRARTPWDFKKSVFADYHPDSDDLLEKCFEKDYSYSRISRIVKKPEQEIKIKAYLRENYKFLRECYKFYAAISPSNNIFCINKTIFNEISNACGLGTSKTLSLKDIDLDYIKTTSGITEKHKFNPLRDLTRF